MGPGYLHIRSHSVASNIHLIVRTLLPGPPILGPHRDVHLCLTLRVLKRNTYLIYLCIYRRGIFFMKDCKKASLVLLSVKRTPMEFFIFLYEAHFYLYVPQLILCYFFLLLSPALCYTFFILWRFYTQSYIFDDRNPCKWLYVGIWQMTCFS